MSRAFILAVALVAASGAFATCDDQPLYFPPTIDAPFCNPIAEETECQCSECFVWDSPDTPQRFEVERTDDAGVVLVVGTVFLPIWCPGKDQPLVVEGSLYVYKIRACNGDQCSAWSATSVGYRAAHYREFNQ